MALEVRLVGDQVKRELLDNHFTIWDQSTRYVQQRMERMKNEMIECN